MKVLKTIIARIRALPLMAKVYIGLAYLMAYLGGPGVGVAFIALASVELALAKIARVAKYTDALCAVCRVHERDVCKLEERVLRLEERLKDLGAL